MLKKKIEREDQEKKALLEDLIEIKSKSKQLKTEN